MVEEFRHRPLLLLFLALLAGLSSAWGVWHLLFALPLFALGRSVRGAVSVVLGLALGWAMRPPDQPLVTVPGGVVDGSVTVVTMPVSTRTGYLVTVQAAERRYRMYFASDPPVLGDRMRLRGAIEPLSDPEYRRRGEAAFLRPSGQVEVFREGWPVWSAAQRLQESFVAFVTREASPRSAPMLAALCFNVTSGLDPAVRQALRRSGTIHLVSASGLHVALVGALVLALLSGLPVPRWAALLLTAALLVVYAGATGLRAPMVRSVVMFAPLALAYLVRRQPDGLSSLALAGTGYLLWVPEDVADPGFQLSFMIVAALFMFRPDREVLTRDGLGTRFVKSAMTVGVGSVIASVAAAPLTALWFGAVSVVGPVPNVLVSFVVPVVMVCAMGAWAVSGFWPALASGVVGFTDSLIGWIVWVAETAASHAWAQVEIGPFSPYWLVPTYALLLMLWRPVRRPAD